MKVQNIDIVLKPRLATIRRRPEDGRIELAYELSASDEQRLEELLGEIGDARTWRLDIEIQEGSFQKLHIDQIEVIHEP